MTVAGRIQPWYCEKCDERGEVTHEEGAGIYTVVNAIDAAHAEANIDCALDWGRAYIRVNAEVN